MDETPKKKPKKCEEEKILKRENDECAVIKTEPTEVEEKQTLPEPVDCVSNEQFPESDILTTFPETPPSFEQYNSEQDTKQHEK